MDEVEWFCRCPARLHAQWPRSAPELRDEAARELWEQERCRGRKPENAVVEWLAQGIPGVTQGEIR